MPVEYAKQSELTVEKQVFLLERVYTNQFISAENAYHSVSSMLQITYYRKDKVILYISSIKKTRKERGLLVIKWKEQ